MFITLVGNIKKTTDQNKTKKAGKDFPFKRHILYERTTIIYF